eukprot:289497_1
MAASSIRPMGTQRKQYLEAMIGLRIIVNPAVDQKLNREYKTGSSRSRQLEQQDENSMVEFATYPYLRDGEWLTIVQYNDENDLLIQPAMHLMNDAFFRHFMIDLVDISLAVSAEAFEDVLAKKRAKQVTNWQEIEGALYALRMLLKRVYYVNANVH